LLSPPLLCTCSPPLIPGPASPVETPSGRKLGYGELAAAASALPTPPADQIKLKDANAFRYTGKGTTPIVGTGIDNAPSGVFGAACVTPLASTRCLRFMTARSFGESIFAVQCLPCHRINGGGVSDIGPDLGQPMAATDYMTEQGLRALLRDPKSVRTWPQQQMPAFSPTVLPETDLNALIAYLKQIASQRGR
jgi:cytochrome c2